MENNLMLQHEKCYHHKLRYIELQNCKKNQKQKPKKNFKNTRS